jgi:hypothetical protein
MAEFEGIANASAAVALDDKYFVVGDDEKRFLFVYRFDHAEWDHRQELKDILKLDKELKTEADIEGAARIGDTIFWIGSHGTDGSGNQAPDRQMLFATTFEKSDRHFRFALKGEIYRKLLDDMQADLTLRKVFRFPDIRRIPPKEQGGMSIEGLAATRNGGLLIGFRNPLVHGLAILLEITNPFEIIEDEAPNFRQPVFLDLGGRGIRDIMLLPRMRGQSREDYLIIGGPWGIDDEPKPALFYWNGKARDKPIMLKTNWPADFNPEALFLTADDQHVWALSDDGKFWRGRGKYDEPKKFRAEKYNLSRLLSGYRTPKPSPARETRTRTRKKS